MIAARSSNPLGTIRDNKMSISAATVGGATLFGLVEYYTTRSAATNWKKTLTYAALGGLAGFASSTAVAQSSDWTQKSGGANWAVIGGSLGFALPLIISVHMTLETAARYSTKDLMKNSLIGALIGGALGTAATYGQKTGLFGQRRVGIY